MLNTAKVTSDHLRRDAYLYVRQSSPHQVQENRESTARQYDFQRHAQALGWETAQVTVIDEDLGVSGASVAGRTGFQRLVADVGLGRVGVVMGLEVSRLARNSADWHRLLEICALAKTLILDEDGIYDPSHFNDRLLLGLHGIMSEAELHILRARLLGGQLNKAKRGELWIRPPIGYEYDEGTPPDAGSRRANPTHRARTLRDFPPHRVRLSSRSAFCRGQHPMAPTDFARAAGRRGHLGHRDA